MQITTHIAHQVEANLKRYIPTGYVEKISESLMSKGLRVDSHDVHKFLSGQKVSHTHILFSTALELIASARKRERRSKYVNRV